MKKYVLGLLVVVSAMSISMAHFGSKGPFGGSVSCAIVQDSVVYVGTYTGGVYQSTNSKLVAWSAKPVGLKQGHITALAHTGKYLFAATPDSGVFRFTGYAGSDRYWEQKSKGLEGQKVTCMVAIDSVTLMVGTSEGGLFKTINKGETWVDVNNSVLHHYEITGLVKAGSRIIHTSVDGGVWATDDLGASWIDFNDDATLHIDGTNALSYNSLTNQLMVINDDGLYRTQNADGLTPHFLLADNGLPLGLKIKSISNNGDNWYLSTDKGIYSSPASVISWSLINTNLPTENVTIVVPFRTSLVCGTITEGLFKTASETINWVPFNSNFNNLKTYSMATNKSLVIAANEKGLFVSKDLATSYIKYNKGISDSLNINDVCFAGASGLFVSTKNAGVFYSADTAKTWGAQNTGLMNLNVKKVFCDTLSGYKYALCADGNVFKSAINQNNWSLSFEGMSLSVLPSSLLFANGDAYLSSSKGVYVSKGGAVWKQENTGLTNLILTSGTIQGAYVFVGTSGAGVFYSDTTNIAWKQITTPIVGVHTAFVNNQNYSQKIQAMASNEEYIFASYKGACYASSDRGLTWVPGGNQFNLPTFSDINKITLATGRLFVTTANNSLYSNGLSELPKVVIGGLSEEVENDIVLYPNPSNGRFNLVSSNKTILGVSVFTLNGDKVYQSEDSNIENINLSKGVYLVAVLTDLGVENHKVIVE